VVGEKMNYNGKGEGGESKNDKGSEKKWKGSEGVVRDGE